MGANCAGMDFDVSHVGDLVSTDPVGCMSVDVGDCEWMSTVEPDLEV